MPILKVKNDNSFQVVVIGAGLAGLSSAYELTKAGKKVLLVEQWDNVGGLARTIDVNGFRFDTGPHRWYTKNDMVNNWMLRLMNKEIIKVPRLTRIYFDNKFFHYPIQIKSTILGMGILKTSLAVFDYLLVQLKSLVKKREAVTIEEGYIDQFGRTLYEMFFRRYTEKLWGRSCRQISSDWLGQRSRGFNIGTVIKNTLFNKEKVVSFIDEFSYPRQGIGRIAERLAKGVIKGGGKILLNSPVVKVSHRQGKIASVTVNNGKSRKEINSRQFISTMAISDLIKALHPPPPATILNVNRKCQYRDEVQVVLFINKTHITKDTWIYVHSLDLPFIRFMEMDNWSKSLSPKGCTSIVFEIACNYGDNIWQKKDAELVELVTGKFISEFKLITRENIIGSYVHRVPKEYPVYHLRYRQDLKILKKYLHRFVNLQIAGRNGIFRYNNMDHSIEMGLYAAWNIIEGSRKFDIESVNIEREYLEEKKVKVSFPELPEDQYVEEKKN
ncbi:hypothetical protein A3D78_06865 [Candidatus Gottesmanbacteria bacterium RIFCSPHIGHO2_02_FULL_39_14]|uniref:Amine oxidase domain-containing protein n=1 Tax=Candidatus Gottesmanbacteria bacterium RIFCSPHIGHO2_02_FULL_39_14 TaxID=1798383 RepID=A0A1F5ZVG9_9BACT|nr:MAG: hypothetical protein A3D78_06865 [Candidatus Gottesmanbacteria bacterium RIFCSPHIGHO2_02_FULL_39_14]